MATKEKKKEASIPNIVAKTPPLIPGPIYEIE